MSSSKLAEMAEQSGMPVEEFYLELRRDYATHVSLLLDDTPPGIVHEYTANFENYRIVVKSYKEQLN